MHYKKIFAIAGIFLAVAIIVPTVIFSLQAQSDLIIIQNPKGMQTGGNVTLPTPQQVQDSHTNNLIIVLVVEAVFLPLFIVAMYFGIKHIHPTH